MRRNRIFPATLIATILIFLIGIAASVHAYQWGAFDYSIKNEAKPMKQKVPKIKLSAAEEQALYEGKPITRLLNSPDGLKRGYLRFFVPYDPVTVWMVVTNAKNFSKTDPSFPKAGSTFDKRRTFMPYTFDATTCVQNGSEMMSQILVMPLVAPRKLCIKRYHNSKGFPWESAWTKVDGMCCEDKMNQEIKDKYFEKAVLLVKNDGCWHIGPLPMKFQKTEADIMRTDCIYYVDTNPGGNLENLKAIVNKATEIAMPSLVENVLFHSKRWEQYLSKHMPGMLPKYKEWKKQYEQSMKEQLSLHSVSSQP